MYRVIYRNVCIWWWSAYILRLQQNSIFIVRCMQMALSSRSRGRFAVVTLMCAMLPTVRNEIIVLRKHHVAVVCVCARAVARFPASCVFHGNSKDDFLLQRVTSDTTSCILSASVSDPSKKRQKKSCDSFCAVKLHF